MTREEAAWRKAQAVAFMERIGQPDRADQFDDMSLDEYADRKGVRLVNPRANKERTITMAGPTKAELQEQLDAAIEILEGAYAPESSREELAAAVGKALDALRDEDEDEDEDGEEEEDEEEDEDDEDSD